ncbi:hypothetical protein Esti_002077 [Eimeria stiedai]
MACSTARRRQQASGHEPFPLVLQAPAARKQQLLPPFLPCQTHTGPNDAPPLHHQSSLRDPPLVFNTHQGSQEKLGWLRGEPQQNLDPEAAKGNSSNSKALELQEQQQ